MRTLLTKVDRTFTLAAIILSFWGAFWALNGADEFFNGTSEPNLAVTSGIVFDVSGEAVHKIHPLQPIGWYGVSNAARFASYFKQLQLPEGLALGVLYAISIAELLLAVLFFYLLARTFKREAPTASRWLYGIAFKGSALVFFVLCIGDILFGERLELWHHGTYLALVLITYDLWFNSDRYFTARAVLGS